MALTLEHILERVGGRWANESAVSAELKQAGRGGIQVLRPTPLAGSSVGELAFFFSKEYKDELPLAGPSILITGEPFVGALEKSGLPIWTGSVIVACADPYGAMGLLSEDFAKELSTIGHLVRSEGSQIHPTAVIHSSVKLGKQIRIGPHCVVDEGSEISDGCVLYPGVVIGPRVSVGVDTVFFPGVVVYENCEIGSRVRIHANSVIGADGFGYAPKRTAHGVAGHQKIYHLGRVVIGDDVEVGASSTIDRGTLGDTVIEKQAKIDNQVQVGHNAHVGEGSIICGGSALAGRARMGRYAVMGGLSGVTNAVTVGDGASVAALSLVTRDVAPGATAVGNPQREYKEHFKAHAALNRLVSERGQDSQERKS